MRKCSFINNTITICKMERKSILCIFFFCKCNNYKCTNSCNFSCELITTIVTKQQNHHLHKKWLKLQLGVNSTADSDCFAQLPPKSVGVWSQKKFRQRLEPNIFGSYRKTPNPNRLSNSTSQGELLNRLQLLYLTLT